MLGRFTILAMQLLILDVSGGSVNIKIGTTNSNTYMNADIIVAYDKMGLKMCGRRCIYQDQCVGINYNPNTLMCEILKAGGTSETSADYLYSPINTWTMDNEACHDNPCSNTKQCVKTKSDGHICVKISTPCDDVICQHGGTCKNGVTSFTCMCPLGTSGTFCEITPCTPAPCQNGGTCSFSGESYSCACALGYYGTNCQSHVCSPNPCQNLGTCAPTGGTNYQCTCTPEYQGVTCTESICDTTPCLHTGTCTPLTLSTYSCNCPTGFSGSICQVTPCDATPCLYSGTCLVSGGSWSCQCPTGYSGTTCQNTPCTGSPCLNGGACSISGSSFTCSCPSGYSGTTCEITPCTSGPCVYGTCYVSGSSYYCTCSSGYSGTICELAYYSYIALSSSQYLNGDFKAYGYFNAGTGVRWLARFVTMNTESCCDHIRIYDGSSASSPLLATRSGTTLPGDVVTTGQYVFITWTTDGSVQYSGWQIDLYRKYS